MPYDRYRQDLARPGFIHDPAQETAVRRLQVIYDQLCAANAAPAPTLWQRLRGQQPLPPAIRGLYLWGGVGRGKTYLVDTFFDALPFPQKRRLHFHRFMQKVHGELRTLSQQQNPLDIVASRFAAKARVICLDEFFVTDITDAMMLAGLLTGLFARRVVFVTTSNIVPDLLYKDGLQRARFLPAIALIKQHMDVLNVDGGTDYRLRYLAKAEIFHAPLDERADQLLEESFAALAPEPGEAHAPLDIEGRQIPTRRLADGVVWFDFFALCDGPRGAADYIEIARCFHTVLLANVPAMDAHLDNQARRFLMLIDEFYDRNVKLILTAAAPIDGLYRGDKLRFEYQRVVSRLQEMQTYEYLGRRHLA